MSVLSLECIAQHEPSMRARGVSKVARSPRGFLTAYRRACSQELRESFDPCQLRELKP